jgi:HK97 family phage prohead protease
VITIVGVIADKLGAVSQTVTVPYSGPGRNFDVRREYFSASSLEYRSVQGAEVLVDHDHDQVVGRVAYLERPHRDGRIHAVCEIDDAGLEGPLFYSPEILHRNGKDIELRRLAVTQKPASVALGAITAFRFPLERASGKIVYQDGWQGELVKRAAEYDRRRKRGEALVIAEPGKPPATLETAATRRPIETRSAQVADVSTPGRMVSIIAAPYGVEAAVVLEGRTVMESFSNVAFIGVREQSNHDKIRVWRDHRPELACGRVHDLNPFDKRGLIARFKLSRTTLGDETLQLANDGVLDASVGFKVLDERWEGRSRRRVTKAWLHHLGLTSDPAYDGTHVLDVRLAGVR